MPKSRNGPPPPDNSSLVVGGLGLKPYIKGRKAKTLVATITRELTEEDILLMNQSELGSKPPALTRIRDTHHKMARLLAEGLKQVEVSAITGVSQSRISILTRDPAFVELVEFYRDNVQAKYVDVHERLSAVALEATGELHHRLMEDAESVKVAELIEIAKLGFDRTGHGPQSTTNVRTVTFTAQELAEMKARVREAEAANVITLTSTEDYRPRLGQADRQEPLAPFSPDTEFGEEGLGLRAEGGDEAEKDGGEGGNLG